MEKIKKETIEVNDENNLKHLEVILDEMETAESHYNLDLASNKFMDEVIKCSLSSDMVVSLLEKETEIYHRKTREITKKTIELNKSIQERIFKERLEAEKKEKWWKLK